MSATVMLGTAAQGRSPTMRSIRISLHTFAMRASRSSCYPLTLTRGLFALATRFAAGARFVDFAFFIVVGFVMLPFRRRLPGRRGSSAAQALARGEDVRRHPAVGGDGFP